jgi:cation diffusion facilitator family transporter
MEIDQRDQKSIASINLGLAANVFLAALKTAIGVLSHSPALLAEGINSTSDVAYYVVASIFIRLARKPADVEHPYGHRQLESIAALIVGSFIITTAVAVFWGSINEVFDLWRGISVFDGASTYALWVALLTVALKLGLTSFTRLIGRQTGSAVVLALASDHRNDVMSASAAALGIFLGQRGYPWVDPMAGALVALLILRTGIEILHGASVDLMDAVPSQQLEAQIRKLLQGVPEVKQVEEVHAHRFGPYLVINLTIGIDGALSVKAGDEIASQVERVLHANIEFLGRVHIHYHPARYVRGFVAP